GISSKSKSRQRESCPSPATVVRSLPTTDALARTRRLHVPPPHSVHSHPLYARTSYHILARRILSTSLLVAIPALHSPSPSLSHTRSPSSSIFTLTSSLLLRTRYPGAAYGSSSSVAQPARGVCAPPYTREHGVTRVCRRPGAAGGGSNIGNVLAISISA
ncbi:hypothetical protein K466DRAFT_654728, partial [Polyporus arcularius HHB13444]